MESQSCCVRPGWLIAHDVHGTAGCFAGYRFQELYAGIERGSGAFPVRYPDARVHQPWAAGPFFHRPLAMPELQPDGSHEGSYVDPQPHDGLPAVALRGLRVCAGEMDIHLRLRRTPLMGKRGRNWVIWSCRDSHGGPWNTDGQRATEGLLRRTRGLHV